MNRYPALIFLAKVYKVFAYVVGALAAIGVLVGLISLLGDGFQRAMGFPLLLQSAVGGGLGCITLLAISEAIQVFVDIEDNTRKTMEYLGAVNK